MKKIYKIVQMQREDIMGWSDVNIHSVIEGTSEECEKQVQRLNQMLRNNMISDLKTSAHKGMDEDEREVILRILETNDQKYIDNILLTKYRKIECQIKYISNTGSSLKVI